MKTKRILIIYGYERFVPGFMQTLIQIASGVFDEIVYVTPPMPKIYSEIIGYPNVKIVTWSRYQRLKQYIKGAFSIFRPWFWKEVIKGPLSISAIKHVGKLFFCSNMFIALSNQTIANGLANGSEVYLLGTWLDAEALTVARLKTKYPIIKGFTFAHSGEVIKERNKFIYQSFHEFIFENVDRTYFISNKVMLNYLKDMNNIRIKERYGDKLSLAYLGSLKISNNMNPDTNKDKLVVLSCSRIDANKRLDRIISALEKWEGGQIQWIHIGTGVLENMIRERASKVNGKNSNVEIIFTGSMDNSEVIRFYSLNSVDLFLNVSASEGLPISIMEAMSYGIPCVATDVGGSSEIVNEKTGYLIPKDFEDNNLIEVIKSYQSLPSDAKNKMRMEAMSMWCEKFNANKNANSLFRSWF